MALSIERRKDSNEVVIHLPEHFDFKVHREFRCAYTEESSNAASYVLDLRQTSYLDSSALGMLLQLREHAGNDRNRVRLVNVNGAIMEILKIANFEKLMTVA
jgi:anti-anti-sigma factor